MKQKRRMVCFALALCLCVCWGSARAVEKGYTVLHGDRERPWIALTVDDCYNTQRVAEVLDLCETYDVPVTFFIIGSVLKDEDAALWQRALDLGCEIGNHTWTHRKLTKLDAQRIQWQLNRTQERLDEVLGFHYPMQVMRPPYGSLSTRPNYISDTWVVNAIAAAGYLHAVRWDVSQTDPEKAVKDVENGSILLYHAKLKDVQCLEQIIPVLMEDYRCVTVSELLGLPLPVYDSAP